MRSPVCWSGGSSSVKEVRRMPNLRRRKIVSQTMLVLTGLCALLAISALLIILGYIFAGGLRALVWDFRVNTPKPIGEPHSGSANGIVGKLILVGLGSGSGLLVGILACVNLGGFGVN